MISFIEDHRGASGQSHLTPHEDATPYALLLHSRLRERFPDVHVFMDLEAIEPGLDFAEVIRQAVVSCAVLVALIGRHWATLIDERGRRRLDDRDDWVRSEIQAALERGVRVIPVLVDGARPLQAEQLPAELRKLARLQALARVWRSIPVERIMTRCPTRLSGALPADERYGVPERILKYMLLDCLAPVLHRRLRQFDGFVCRHGSHGRLCWTGRRRPQRRRTGLRDSLV
jgi:hypothetical protein